MKFFLLLGIFFAVGCATTQPRGYELPPALSEVLRNGAVKGLEDTSGQTLGYPSPHDQVAHTCTSVPIYNAWGYYVRTAVYCH